MTIPWVFPSSEVFIPYSTNTACTPQECQFQDLKRRLPLPHDNHDSKHTCMHAGYTYAQRHIRECFHTHAYRVGLFLLHTLTCPRCPPPVYSWRPQCWYHLILSQLHQPTPCPPQKEPLFFLHNSRICVPCQVFFCLIQPVFGIVSHWIFKHKQNLNMKTILGTYVMRLLELVC